MENQKDESKLTPEVAYVSSIDLIEKGISDVNVYREKAKFYQRVGLFASLVVGVALGLLTEDLSNVFKPIILINGVVLPLYTIVLNVFKNVIEDLESDKTKLVSGELNPIDYFIERRDGLAAEGPTEGIRSLSSDTSKLTPEERKMLSKFSDESTSKTK